MQIYACSESSLEMRGYGRDGRHEQCGRLGADQGIALRGPSLAVSIQVALSHTEGFGCRARLDGAGSAVWLLW